MEGVSGLEGGWEPGCSWIQGGEGVCDAPGTMERDFEAVDRELEEAGFGRECERVRGGIHVCHEAEQFVPAL